ncbi:flavodoxin family protein [Candidatus Omnitrophota bacterium]
MSVKILGISGSPRPGGNTDILLDKALEGAKSKGVEIEKIILDDLKFSPCKECENAKDDGSCLLKDDMQEVYRKIKAADAIIFASPIFFGSLSAQAKMMIDRFQCPWRAKYILKKDIGYKKIKGAFISVESSNRKDFFENARSIVKNLFVTINAEYKEELFCPEVDKKADVLNRPDYLEKAAQLGAKLIGG